MSADYWPACRDKKGVRVGAVNNRYPENLWRNLDLCTWLLAPGPTGAVSTSRFENLLAGAQECEARIFLEDALLDNTKKVKIGADLARRCQDALDERQHAMWKTIWNDENDLASVNQAIGSEGQPVFGLWTVLCKATSKKPTWAESMEKFSAEAQKGRAWYFASDRLGRTRKLFTLAGEVAAKINP